MHAILRNLQHPREVITVFQNFSPALLTTGHHTCKSALLSQACVHKRNLHNKYQSLVKPQACVQVQKCGLRKLYPDPFQEDPEYFLLPEEKTHLDLTRVPELGNKGPDIVENIQEAAKSESLGRLFAVVHIGGKQRKVTTEDMVLVNGFFPPQIGDKIRLEKVMLVGGKNFTLCGRPLLNRDTARVEATVIQKTLSHVKVHFTMLKRFRRLKLLQNPQTVLVINSIEVNPSAL